MALLDQVELVVGIEDDEVRVEGQVVGLAAQDAGTGGVEGAQGYPAGLLAKQGHHAVLHLTGGLVGEGDRQDVIRAHAHGADQVSDALGQHAGLARARAGQNQYRAQTGGDRLLLLRVEAGEEVHVLFVPC